VFDDTLMMRFNVKQVDSDGYIENIHPIGGGNDSKYQYARGSLRWTPNEKLTIDASFQYATEDVGMREGVQSGVFGTFSGEVLYPGEFPDRDGDGKTDPFVDTVGFIRITGQDQFQQPAKRRDQCAKRCGSHRL
jgi:iron complex outermembrane receptor protein